MMNYADDDIHINIDFTYEEVEGLSNITGCYPNIIIEDGGVLRVKKTLKMAEESRIIVKKGGKLFIDGGTITTCGFNFNETWKGIIVEGDENLPQVPFSNQGYMNIQNEGTIRNAEQAVTLHAGGFIYGKNGNFENNGAGVLFESYNLSNFSRFEDCTFLVNDEINTNFTEHVKMESVNTINFVNTDFINAQTSAFNIEDFGRGILAHDARFGIGGNCVFEGLYVGVEAGAFSAPQHYNIRTSNFNNNVIGILSIGVNNFEIKENNFSIGGFSGAPLPSQDFHVGIELMEGTGFDLSENNFTGDSGTENTIGILVEDLGEERNSIESNEFSFLSKGNQAQRNNAGFFNGLEYLCNSNSSNHFDFVVNLESDIAPVQGIGLATTNTFSHTTFEDNSDFLNLGPAITYFHRDIAAETPEEGNYVGLNLQINDNSVLCGQPNGNDQGPVIVVGPIDQTLFHLARNEFDNIVNTSGELTTTLRILAAQKGKTVYDLAGLIIRDLIKDTENFNTDSLKIWLSNKRSLEGALERASLSIDTKSELPFNQTAFYQEMQQIENDFDLTLQQAAIVDDYSELIALLLNNPQSIYKLGTSGESVLTNYANNGIGKSAVTSKALLNFAYQSHYRIVPQVLANTQQSVSNPNINQSTNLADQQLKAYPNPAKNEVVLAYHLPENFGAAQIAVYNLHGRLIKQFNLNDTQGKIAWNIEHLSDGCYYYQLTHSEASASIQKLIIIK